MELTKQQAIDLSMASGDRSMVAAGRNVWSAEDAKAATEEFNRLHPVQKMDETPAEEQDEAD
jgi:hypothetical protein